jgi:hypothetical protein
METKPFICFGSLLFELLFLIGTLSAQCADARYVDLRKSPECKSNGQVLSIPIEDNVRFIGTAIPFDTVTLRVEESCYQTRRLVDNETTRLDGPSFDISVSKSIIRRGISCVVLDSCAYNVEIPFGTNMVFVGYVNSEVVFEYH